MKIHPREQVVGQAKCQIKAAILAAVQAHGLTNGELSSILAEEIASVAKYQIRAERHPNDPDKPGGLA